MQGSCLTMDLLSGVTKPIEDAFGGDDLSGYNAAMMGALIAFLAIVSSLLGLLQLMHADTFTDSTVPPTSTEDGRNVRRYALAMSIFAGLSLIVLPVLAIQWGAFGVGGGEARGKIATWAMFGRPIVMAFVFITMFGILITNVVLSCKAHDERIATYQVQDVAWLPTSLGTFDWKNFADGVYITMIIAASVGGVAFLFQMIKLNQARRVNTLGWNGEQLA